MSTRTLYLAWKDKRLAGRPWFPVARLDVEPSEIYRFRYIQGAKRAKDEAGFCPLLDFPDFQRDYRSGFLFALFRNRVIAPKRPDRKQYLDNLALSESADPFSVLSVNGGTRVTDAFEVFPKIEKDLDGEFNCRFFLHGWEHVGEAAHERILDLEPDEELRITLELNNPATGLAVQLQSNDYCMIGWTPRYLVADLATAVADAPAQYVAKVVRVNPAPAPWEQRVLVEFSGRWERHEPMSSSDFEPLVT